MNLGAKRIYGIGELNSLGFGRKIIEHIRENTCLINRYSD